MKLFTKLSLLLFVTVAMVSCKNSNDKADTSAAEVVAEVTGKTYNVNSSNSLLLWNASKVTGKHNGSVNVSGGTLSFEGDVLTGGNFTIDMNSINVMDLEGDQKASLEAHLKGTADGKETDFFNSDQYPTAKFDITKATQLNGNNDANYVINGNLTIKEVTKNISFRAMVNESNGTVKVTTPEFTIDRTEWGVQYGSTKFFDNLKDKAINDEITFTVSLMAS